LREKVKKDIKKYKRRRCLEREEEEHTEIQKQVKACMCKREREREMNIRENVGKTDRKKKKSR
jgi:hypothetical protein